MHACMIATSADSITMHHAMVTRNITSWFKTKSYKRTVVHPTIRACDVICQWVNGIGLLQTNHDCVCVCVCVCVRVCVCARVCTCTVCIYSYMCV